jgi:hypothetical protein
VPDRVNINLGDSAHACAVELEDAQSAVFVGSGHVALSEELVIIGDGAAADKRRVQIRAVMVSAVQLRVSGLGDYYTVRNLVLWLRRNGN